MIPWRSWRSGFLASARWTSDLPHSRSVVEIFPDVGESMFVLPLGQSMGVAEKMLVVLHRRSGWHFLCQQF